MSDNTLTGIYVNKTENRVTFRLKTGYYLQDNQILTPETMNLLGSTKSKITKGKNGENVSHSEITKVVLVHCNIITNNYQQNLRTSYTFVPNNWFNHVLDVPL